MSTLKKIASLLLAGTIIYVSLIGNASTVFAEQSTNPTTESLTEITEPSTEMTAPSLIESDTEPDLSPPVLNVNIPNQYSWTNSLADWEIEFSEGADIYYKISDSTDVDWGNYTDNDAFLWNYGNSVPEGKHFIKFWAVFPNSERPVNDKVAPLHYQYDCTAPSDFSIEESFFYLKATEPITDTDSGVQGIYYMIGNNKLNSANEIRNKCHPTNIIEVDGNKKVNFSVRLSLAMKLQTVHFYVIDNADNFISVSTDKTKDLDTPEFGNHSIIRTEKDNNDKINEVEKDRITFDSALSIDSYKTNYYYISDTDYIKVAITEEHLKNVTLTATVGEKEYSVEVETNKMRAPEGIEASADTYYIPVSELGKVLQNDGVHNCLIDKLVISAKDNYNHNSDSKNNITETDLFYDGFEDDKDIIVKPNFNNANAFTSETVAGLYETVDAYFNQTVNISYDFEDDYGLLSYKVTLSKLTENDNKEISYIEKDNKTSNKDLIVKETIDDITYTVPSKKETCPQLKLTDDGEYLVDITVFDLAGNCRTRTYCYVVDKTAPTIDNFEYTETSDILRYFTFGIFGKESVSISIKVTDNLHGAGFDNDKVLLFWDNEEPYVAVHTTDGYVFKNLPINNSGNPHIQISDRLKNVSDYYFTTVLNSSESKPDKLLSKNNSNVMLTLENDNPICEITPMGKGNVIDNKAYRIGLTEDDNNPDNTLYFGKSSSDDRSRLSFTFSDNKGLEEYTIIITNESGEVVKKKTVDFKNEAEPVLDSTTEIEVADFSSGQYKIEITATDLAGNNEVVVSADPNNQFDVTHFKVDVDAPIIENNSYNVSNTVLNYLTFGIFGNKDIDITVKNSDLHSAVKDLALYWDKSKPYQADFDNISESYTFKGLPINSTGKPHIVITDMLGNVNDYYFISSKMENDETIGELIVNDPDEGVILMLENKAPQVDTYVSAKFENNKHMVGKEAWYGTGVQYMVNAIDAENSEEAQIQSGLNKIEVSLSDSEGKILDTATETSYDGTDFKVVPYTGNALYAYDAKQEGHYIVNVEALDNAGNLNSDSDSFHIDLNDPKITAFRLDSNNRNEPFFEDFYGYFFQKDTELRVYVQDPGVSSGFGKVDIHLNSTQKDAQSYNFTIYGSELSSDANGTYAVCTVPAGFKGELYAEVADNVTHTSGLIKSDGSVLETSEIHKNTSSLTITPNIQTSHTDANNVPLYNTSVPLTVSVADTYSGIATIEWSIADDNESGVITVDIKGNCSSDSAAAIINNDSVKKDENLVTMLNFSLSVDSNTNGNVVQVKVTDRSGNTTQAETKISIDMTVPTITAVKSNTNPINSNYYNTPQTVTISITERNFNPTEVVVLVNGNTQSVSWNDAGPSVTTDTTVHNGTFTLTSDNRYVFSVIYSDMADNAGTSFNEPEFVIDQTNPIITNNFAEFETASNEEHYFNIKSKDKAVATISVDEVNFLPDDMHLNVYYKSPGSSHNDNGWSNYPYPSAWTSSGNVHNLTITFSEDGVYKITMSPVDRADNAGMYASGSTETTIIFEVDFTAPVIYQRNDINTDANETQFIDLYDYERRKDDAPNVVFMDTNIERIDYKLKTYLPVYKEDKSIGTIIPDEKNNTIKTTLYDTNNSQMQFTLNDFEKDGIYSVNLTAYDKAGNESLLNEDTYIRMVNTNVLAYIENSDKYKQNGWYSFEDENGPISKQPTNFSDLSIVVLSKTDAPSTVCLVDKATDESTDTKITDNQSAVFDNEMFDAAAYRYKLPGSYFAEHYTADADTSLYLRVNNGNNSLDLGELYIDNTNPTCIVPDNFTDWAMIGGTGNKTIEFTNISEILDSGTTVAYVDNNTISIDKLQTEGQVNFAYNQEENKISLTLEPGSHKAGLMLVDRAGNTTSIQEVQHLAIGNHRIWIGVGAGAFGITIGALAILLTKIIQRKKNAI